MKKFCFDNILPVGSNVNAVSNLKAKINLKVNQKNVQINLNFNYRLIVLPWYRCEKRLA